MVIPIDPEYLNYGWSKCGRCGAELVKGKNLNGSNHKCRKEEMGKERLVMEI